MMRVSPIDDPVTGEQILAVQPPLARNPEAGWQQRLEYFTGRALTHTALRQEQQVRSGRLATIGQVFSPGVVSGLETVAAATEGGALLEIAAGAGLAVSGEIVTVNRNQQVRLDDIRVYAPAAMLAGGSATTEGAYRLGDALAALRAHGLALPQAMVLVLQPVAVEHFSALTSTDPCEYDPTDAAFENWQVLDGCRLALHAWPAELGPLPEAGSWRRNRIAHAVFEYERTLTEGDYPPWWSLGVPIALVGLTPALAFDFLDRYSVVRRGGEAKGGSVPVSPAGNRFLWQARFEQFNEQLADWLTAHPELDPAGLAAEGEFRHLPPVGVLPKECMAPRSELQHFFPLGYGVRALAIPYEQLDLAIAESAPLLPYDLNTPDQVEVLVPVPQAHFEPRLLVVETVDPVFERTIARFAANRDQWLGRRLNLRRKASAIYHAVKGRPLLYPVADFNAVDSLEQAAPFELELVKQGDACRFLTGLAAPPPDWLQNGFDDSPWAAGATGIGYGRAGLATTVADMQGHAVTLYVRHRFQLSEVAEAHRYTLSITTNGGFYAYLNGRPLTAANASRPLYNVPADATLPFAARTYELGELTGRLLAGENVLAIEAHSPGLNAAEFSISVTLLDTEEAYGTTVVPGAANQPPPFGREQYQVTALAELRTYLDTKTPLSDAEVAKLDEIGIEEYIDFLQAKIDRADDRVEFGFLRLRTDIYRVRQMMLGNEAATKLATSPALAEIAKGQSAVATKTELNDFYSRLKQATPTGGPTLGPTAAAKTASAATAARSAATTGFFSGELAAGSGVKIDTGAMTTFTEGTIKTGASQEARLLGIASEASSGELLKYATAEEVGLQNPVIGKVQIFNNATVGERLEESSANVAHMAGVAVKGELVSELLATDLHLDDLAIPGVRDAEENKDKTFADIKADADLLGRIIGGHYDPVGGDDEASYFNGGVRALENVVGLLRLVEGRVHAYRRAVTECRNTVAALQSGLAGIDGRLKVIGDELAEARHDVSVAMALKAEEQARINAINAGRDKVLATLVPFVLFRRPRTVDARRDAPLHFVNPDLSEQPLPLCDLTEVEAPDALEAMLDVVRDAPLKWFIAVNLILPHLSRLADLQVTLAGARKRAATVASSHPYLQATFQGTDKTLQGIGAVLMQSQQRIAVTRRLTASLDLAAFQRLGWQESIARVPEVVSLGDLIDASHGRMAASSRAAAEMNMISRVATCLYARFSGVPAAIRLGWAERLSQYDAPVNLRNLYTLPRFSELDYTERHNMQRLVDWLYGRINGSVSEATGMMSDLIRVALLAASHAPVNRLIAGYLPAPVLVRPGSRFHIVPEAISRVRVGMAISMTAAGATLVRGKVVDITGSQVMVEAHTTVSSSVQLETGTRVQIG
jgi:hypothetical protein